MADHGCRAELVKAWNDVAARRGQGPVEVTVSAAPPLVANPYTTACTCPHGTTYWIEPTGDQRARWAAEATP